jgi:FdhD protein
MRLPGRSVQLTQVTEWDDGQVRSVEDYLAAEEPLEIRIGEIPLTVTMRTPGHDAELAAGFLWTEGLVDAPNQIGFVSDSEMGAKASTESAARNPSIQDPFPQASSHRNLVRIELRNCSFDPSRLQRNFFAASSCGICGKASIEAVRRRGLQPLPLGFRIDPDLLCQLPGRLRDQQQVFGRTGGLHAAALFDAAGNLLALREDIGRHNAVDKIVGWAIGERLLPLSSHVLMVSGRGGFEIIQKALAAGIPVVASVSAPSSLAVKLARELSLTLVGFLRGRRFVVYAGAERCLAASPCER